MSPKKVLHISTPATWRGGEQQLYYLLQAQRQSIKILPHLICQANSALAAKVRQLNIPIFEQSKRSSLDISFAARIARIISTEHIDIVHVHDSHAHTFTFISGLLFRWRAKVIIHRRVDYPVSDTLFSRWKYNWRKINSYICVSHEVQRVLRQCVGKHIPSKVIYSGIDVERFSSSLPSGNLHDKCGISRDAKIVAHIGALEQQKDYLSFIEISKMFLSQYSDQEIHFVGIGEGSQRELLEHRINSWQLNEMVHLPGFLYPIESFIQDIDILLFTSEKEGLGTSIIDAMACGLPIIASEVGGIPELIRHGKNGLLEQPKNINGFVDKLRLFLEDVELRNELSARAREDALRFSIDTTTQQIEDYYLTVCPD